MTLSENFRYRQMEKVSHRMMCVDARADGDGCRESYPRSAATVVTTIRKFCRELVLDAVSALPAPQDGRSDATALEIFPAIDEQKSFPRGTYATPGRTLAGVRKRTGCGMGNAWLTGGRY